MSTFTLDPGSIRDIAPDVLGPDGRLRVLPTSYWATTTPDERAMFGHVHGIYSFPTEELVAYLNGFIGDRKAIEIGAGHGVLADALGIPGTDSRQQEVPKYAAMLEVMQQPPVPYGPNIVHLDAQEAVRKYRPDVVIGCWVTHRYSPRRHHAGGNEAGINEDWIIDHCASYVVVGNDKVHAGKPIWKRSHVIVRPDFVYSRAQNGTPDFIATWG